MRTDVLAAAIIGFLLGGLTVSVAAELESDDGGGGHASSSQVSHQP